MPKSYVVLTAIGPDRSGLVDNISEYVYQHGGNVEGSRMARLGGEFAIIMFISGEPSATTAIENDIETLIHGAKLICYIKPTAAPEEHRPQGLALPYELSVHSMDHPGIVRAVAHQLAERGVNIESLDTFVDSAPHTGTTVFHLRARLSLPAQLNIPKFRAELETLAESLNVDINLSAADD